MAPRRTTGDHDSAGSRVPPSNVDAEASLLGAALLSRHGVEALLASTRPADFYKPAHQHLAAAITALAADDTPIDLVTVAEHLRRTGLLELVGGTAGLADITATTPSISTAGQYARIVHDTATLRHVITLGANIADAAYAAPDPAAALRVVGQLVEGLDTSGALKDLSTLEVANSALMVATDLDAEEATMLVRTDGGALFYGGKMHMLQAEPSAGKSWIACHAIAEVLAAGGAAIYLDCEDTPRGIFGRLLRLGVDVAAIADRFLYMAPSGPIGPAERADLGRHLDALNPDLVIIDGVGEALAREGLSEDKASDVLGWCERVPRPIARTGAAVVMIDHVVKDPEQRGRWARGTGAKLAMIDGASYQLRVATAFSRHHAGAVKLIVAKDRPGSVGPVGATVAVARITPHGGGERVVITIDPNTDNVTPTDAHKPTHTMERVADLVATSATPLTATAVRYLLPNSRSDTVRAAIARLISEGFLREAPGRTKHLQIVRPYTAPDHDRPPPHTDADYHADDQQPLE